MSIRKATKRETQQIVGHSLHVLKEASMGHIPPKKEKALQMVSPFLSDGGYYLVYTDTDRDEIRGWIGIGSTTDYYTDKPVGIIPELYVLPQYRKHGIAEKLCTEALKHLRKSGFSVVQLNVFAGNAIKSFYQKLGFKEVTTLMEKNLD
ncbi:Acetyltransferase (GNAT) family protein [Lentibacillus halodurans]|uniref:Acetyltransferase (GNAT) family protein n=1 Tax=Lentibacillus halodurans TaxID=237679 RepID=A0A1I0W9K3_9BACI|nr:GNAT family N-acetyltransferase [Lentibacillus halodurans]SFA85291.1 Acetyltransferase (GNAT) family protein [Lentibacillus halodurans]